jgi:GntR family transcriptional regulator
VSKWAEGALQPLKAPAVPSLRPGGALATSPSQVTETAPTGLLTRRSGGPLMVASGPPAQRRGPRGNVTSWYRGDLYQMTMQHDRPLRAAGRYPTQGGTR